MAASAASLPAQQSLDTVQVRVNQYAPLTDKIQAAVATLGPGRSGSCSTRTHGDHSGANEDLGKGGVLTVEMVYQSLTVQ